MRPTQPVSHADIADKVRVIIRDALGLDPQVVINYNTAINSYYVECGSTPPRPLASPLNDDSLIAMEIILDLEEEFDVALPDSEVPRLNTVMALTEYIATHLAQPATA